MKKVAHDFVVAKRSICHLIQHSDVFRARFQRNIRLQKYNPTTTDYIKSLSSAKHRFNSHAKPFGRGVIFYDAHLQTAQNITDERKGAQESKDASAFLDIVDEESSFQFACLAEAGDENMMLTRVIEDEVHDKSQLAPEVCRFLQRIHTLFVQCQCLKGGYVEHMMNVLSKERIIYSLDGAPRKLGGQGALTTVVIKRCMMRMINWVKLAEEVVRVEFANFDLLMAFDLFQIDDKPKSDVLQGRGFDESVARVCHILKLDKARFISQFEDHLPMALHAAATKKLVTFAAWKHATDLSMKDRRSRVAHPSDTLRKAL